MKIKFVNHASFIVEHNGISVISDPWLEGRVFNNGWSLLSPSKFTFDDFKDIDYIWFSHEHPDHFFPPNIKKIPLEYKKNITVLFQETIDKRVYNFCKNAGFKDVIELKKDEFFNINDDFKVMCEHFDEGDSWICYKAGGETILNTNDCALKNEREAEYIKKKVGDVDVLLTQFSYAYWAGNREDVEYRKGVAKNKLDLLKFQCDIFKPKVTIPVASFVYFCHEENFYLNDNINTVETAFNFLKKNTTTTPVVLYNGDEYTCFQNWDSPTSIKNYNEDYARISLEKGRLVKGTTVALEDIQKQAAIFIENLKISNGFLVNLLLKDTKIHVWDYDVCFNLSIKNGLQEINMSKEECDVSLSSESFFFCLKFPYGLDTTQINGRLQKPKKGNYSRFYNFFRIDQQKSRGQELTLKYLSSVVVRKIGMKLGLYKT